MLRVLRGASAASKSRARNAHRAGPTRRARDGHGSCETARDVDHPRLTGPRLAQNPRREVARAVNGPDQRRRPATLGPVLVARSPSGDVVRLSRPAGSMSGHERQTFRPDPSVRQTGPFNAGLRGLVIGSSFGVRFTVPFNADIRGMVIGEGLGGLVARAASATLAGRNHAGGLAGHPESRATHRERSHFRRGGQSSTSHHSRTLQRRLVRHQSRPVLSAPTRALNAKMNRPTPSA